MLVLLTFESMEFIKTLDMSPLDFSEVFDVGDERYILGGHARADMQRPFCDHVFHDGRREENQETEEPSPHLLVVSWTSQKPSQKKVAVTVARTSDMLFDTYS